MKDLLGLLPEDIDALVQELGQPRYRAEQLMHALYRRFARSTDDLPAWPASLRLALAERGYIVSGATELGRSMSEDGETTKLLLAMGEQRTPIETVLMQYRNEAGAQHPRSTVCVSTQAGCAMGCVFCATGQMGFERNLTAGEIVAQVIEIARLLAVRGEHVTNVVFMGMGEPLANYDQTMRAVRILTDPRALGLGQRHITISTVGVLKGIERLAAEHLQVGLAISLHAPNETLRRSLVPTAGAHSVRDLAAAGQRYFEATGRRVTYEYALIAGVNDNVETAAELGALLRRTGSHVNLIPVNPTAGGYAKPSRNRVLAFERTLQAAGVNCTVRVEKGSAIAAACGQLRTEAARSRRPREGDEALPVVPPGTRPGDGLPTADPSPIANP